MNSPLHPQYVIRFTKGKRKTDLPMTKVWNGTGGLVMGHPARFLLNKKGDQILIRDLGTPEGLKAKVFTSHPQISIEMIKPRAAISWEQIAKIGQVEFTDEKIVFEEETFFKKQAVRVAASAAVFMLAVFLFKPSAEDIKAKNDELIPAKYAKIIMTKPIEKSVAASGGASQSSGQKKAIARVFQSATVQKSLKSILKGGLSKYSIMSTGRAITTLATKVSQQTGGTAMSLNAKADSLIAGANVGPMSVGNGTGYGTGNGTNVNGQGSGSLSIGLNTDDAAVDEGLTKDEVARVIHAHLNEIRFCYENAILKNPELAGKVLVDFKINPNGAVPNAGVAESSMEGRTPAGNSGGGAVGSCLVAKLRNWKFPQPRGGVFVAVSYPFIFKSMNR
jgi:hypothetical protein